jgi:hypothetical protein
MARRHHCNCDCLGNTQTRALTHPLRLRILEMHRRTKSRPLSVVTLTDALAQTHEFRDVKAAEVKYHLDRLRDAELLPEACS